MKHETDIPRYNPIPQITRTLSNDKRSAGRVACNAITCSLGEIINASIAGMRILSRRRLPIERRDFITFEVNGLEDNFPLRAQVIWIKKRGLRRHEVGLELLDSTPADVKKMGKAILGSSDKAASLGGLCCPKHQNHRKSIL